MAVTDARREREALCDLFLDVGPDVPTLCEGWSTRDLAAHLVVRESRPDASIGLVFPPAAKHGERVRLEVAKRPWNWLVDDVRGGPPRWNPMGIPPIEKLANTAEFFVHHEDVRRAQDGWEPRELSPSLTSELARIAGGMPKLMMRKAPARATLVNTGTGTELTVGSGSPVTVSGPGAELVLFAFGRQSHARVDLHGEPQAVAALLAASFGV